MVARESSFFFADLGGEAFQEFVGGWKAAEFAHCGAVDLFYHLLVGVGGSLPPLGDAVHFPGT